MRTNYTSWLQGVRSWFFPHLVGSLGECGKGLLYSLKLAGG